MEMVGVGGSVVPFRGLRKVMENGADRRFPVVAEVRAYWEGLRNGHQVPQRAQIDPRGIERALEYAFILERIAPQVARFRLAGMHLNDLMGMEVRGMPLSAFFAPAARPQIGEAIERVFAGPAIVEMDLTAESGFGKPACNAALLILPLRSDLGDVTRALGCLVCEGPIGRTPRRFDRAELRLTALDAGRPTGPGATIAPIPARGFAEPAATFGATALTGRSRTHLRLVKTGD